MIFEKIVNQAGKVCGKQFLHRKNNTEILFGVNTINLFMSQFMLVFCTTLSPFTVY